MFVEDNGYNTSQWWQRLEKQRLYKARIEFTNHPRENVSWDEAVAFCRWLSAKIKYRETALPSEEEWEKAARKEQGLVLSLGKHI